MEIRVDSLDFSQPLRGDGPRVATTAPLFPRDVLSAVAGMTGYLTESAGTTATTCAINPEIAPKDTPDRGGQHSGFRGVGPDEPFVRPQGNTDNEGGTR